MRPILLTFLCALFAFGALAEDGAPAAPAPAPAAAMDKRIFGVLPNYRTADGSVPFEPLTAKQKFRIAYKDSFDYPVFGVAGAFSALSHLENSNPSFGQGFKGYAHRYATSYGDQMIGNVMTEGLFPAMLHEDPRYFRHPGGSKWFRAGYALSRVLVTRTDSGGQRFNYSEILGNASATAISNSYSPDSRDVEDNLQKLYMQVATDAFSNVLKEFWPDIKKKFFTKHHAVSAN